MLYLILKYKVIDKRTIIPKSAIIPKVFAIFDPGNKNKAAS